MREAYLREAYWRRTADMFSRPGSGARSAMERRDRSMPGSMPVRFTPRLRIAAASLVAVAGVLALVAVYAPRPATRTAHGAPRSSASQSLPTAGLTFASTPTSAAILSSSVVTAAGKGTSAGSVASNETATLTKWPKGHGPASVHGNGGVN